MNLVNGPVLAALLVALVILVLVVDAQRRVIVRLRESLRCSRSRASVLREKLAIAERHTCLSSGLFREPPTDGWGVWAMHGVRVPQYVVESPERITIDAIWAETNAEVRRVMIDQVGWERFVTDARLSLVASCDDPANPGHTLDLYDLPEQVYDEPVRVVLCTNASPERDGTRRRFGITVPADVEDPVAGIAWTFDVEPEQYRALVRAT